MNMKRMRGRNHRGGGGGGSGGGGGPVRHQSGNVPLNRNHVFDSQGPDLRIRGTAQQLFEKYLQLGRDATSGGDRVMAESYFQYAEHYYRITGAIQAAQQQGGQHQQHQYRRPMNMQDAEIGPEPDGDDEPAGLGEQPGHEAQQRDQLQRDVQHRDHQNRDLQHRDVQHRDYQQRDAQQRDMPSRDIPIAAAPPES